MEEKILPKDRLRELRAKKGLTRNQLHEATELSNNALRDWELGDCIPNGKYLVILADYYGVSIDYIMCRTDNPEINQ